MPTVGPTAPGPWQVGPDASGSATNVDPPSFSSSPSVSDQTSSKAALRSGTSFHSSPPPPSPPSPSKITRTSLANGATHAFFCSIHTSNPSVFHLPLPPSPGAGATRCTTRTRRPEEGSVKQCCTTVDVLSGSCLGSSPWLSAPRMRGPALNVPSEVTVLSSRAPRSTNLGSSSTYATYSFHSLPPQDAIASSLPISGSARFVSIITPSPVFVTSHLVIQSVTVSRNGMAAAGTRPTPCTYRSGTSRAMPSASNSTQHPPQSPVAANANSRQAGVPCAEDRID
mmetsp:Transcript_6393/g.15917  ORF Transcript_6393/g.15917 Transcript_6393/m.15917 type:complete len:283 (-) Transcript_6393:661-1509(-)